MKGFCLTILTVKASRMICRFYYIFLQHTYSHSILVASIIIEPIPPVFSQASCDDVRVVMRVIKPSLVFLELCQSRVALLRPPKKEKVR